MWVFSKYVLIDCHFDDSKAYTVQLHEWHGHYLQCMLSSFPNNWDSFFQNVITVLNVPFNPTTAIAAAKWQVHQLS